MTDSSSDEKAAAIRHALALISQAIDTLDAASIPPALTAPLELARAELQASLKY